MKSRQAILEYCEKPAKNGRKREWGFRFKTGEGKVLMESQGGFSSLGHAEKGFLAMIKSIATNKYSIATGLTKAAARRATRRAE
jgi:hypothetical protein